MVSGSYCFAEAHGLGCLHDGACCHFGLLAALPTLIPPEPASVNESMSSALAAWTTKAMRPTHLGQGNFTLSFRPVERLELGHGEPLLELNGVAPHDLSGICVPLCGLAASFRESSA